MSSPRTILAASVSALSFIFATMRGSGFMPQSVLSVTRSGRLIGPAGSAWSARRGALAFAGGHGCLHPAGDLTAQRGKRQRAVAQDLIVEGA